MEEILFRVIVIGFIILAVLAFSTLWVYDFKSESLGGKMAIITRNYMAVFFIFLVVAILVNFRG